ncbi:hypothetical protein Tco_0162408 [Tanacetum coccineum]
MAALESCPKHNMISYLEKTNGNAEFHEIIDFLTRSSIQYTLTVSPMISTTFVEQFWMSAKSKTINNVRYINAIVTGEPVTISEASIRSDLLFDDADGIGSLNNQVIVQAKEIKALKAQVKKLKKGAKPLITHHKTWMKSVAMNTRLARKTSLKKKGVQKESVSKQGRKSIKYFKGEPYVHKDLSFEDLDDLVDVDDTLDYMETKDALDEEGTSSVVLEEKESADKEVSTEAHVSTIKSDEGTDKRNEGTDKQDGGTDSTKVSTDRQGEGTADQNEGTSATQTALTKTSTPTPTIFDDETIAQVLITMSQNKQKEKEKGIDLKDKGKKMIDEEGESDTESDDITEAEKKFKMLAKDEEVARKVQEEWEAEEEKKRLAEEEATKAALTNEYDFIQARINADKILAEEL